MSNSLLSSLFTLTDEQAMWRVQTQDDSAAFAQLMKRWEGPIRNLCIRMTGNIHGGEDLAQETFARLYVRRHQYQPSGKFSTYLWRIALNLCYDELRRLNRRSECSLDDDQRADTVSNLRAFEPGPDVQLEQTERTGMVRDALLQLSENHRTVLVLRHYENLKFREIADVLEIPEGTVKSRMAEAITQLSRQLKSLAVNNPGPVSDSQPRSVEKVML